MVAKKIPYPSKRKLSYIHIINIIILIMIVVIANPVGFAFVGVPFSLIIIMLIFLRKLILIWETQDGFWNYFNVLLVPGKIIIDHNEWPKRNIFWRIITVNFYPV